jgi:hypothetical protein
MPNSLYLKFENLSRPVKLTNCANLIDHFPLIFSDWNVSELTSTSQEPIITISRDSAGAYSVDAEWMERPLKYTDEVDTICGLVAKLIRAWVMNDMNLLCLHGAAAEFGGALVVFPNKYRAGKSVLSACIAAAGYKLYSDDILPINLANGEGIAPGIAPRLRSPYPDNLNDSTRSFIDSRVALEGERYHYLDLRGETLAERNCRLPIGAFVFLERSEGVKTSLEPISESEVLRQVVWQNFAREVDAPSILGRLAQIVNGAQRYLMRYDRADDAVELLAETFRVQNTSEIKSAQQDLKMQLREDVVIDVPAGHLLRKNGISEISADENSFLANDSGTAIHQLNPVGSAIWNLLSEPMTTNQIVAVLLTAFPEAEPAQVETDVRNLLKGLDVKNLLIHGPRMSKQGETAK